MKWNAAGFSGEFVSIPMEWVEATAEDGAIISVGIGFMDDLPQCCITVNTADGKYFDSSNTRDWPAIEAYLPRGDWPTCHYHGKGGDVELQTWIDSKIKEYEAETAALEEEEKEYELEFYGEVFER